MDFKEELARKAEKVSDKKAALGAVDENAKDDTASKATVQEAAQIKISEKENGAEKTSTENMAEHVSGPAIRLLNPTEIECRVGVIKERGLSLLLYKDARVDQRILDETFGMFGWQRSHEVIDGNLYCTVSVYDKGSGRWVSKQDVGTVGFAEKEKSQASDSFKRACFNWGIGRELYTAPFIWIPAERTEIVKKGDGDKWFCKDSFHVRAITYNAEKEIKALMIVNQRGVVVYNSGIPAVDTKSGNVNETTAADTIGRTAKKKKLSAAKLRNLAQELDRTGVSIEEVKARYPFDNVDNMTDETYKKVMMALAKTPDASAA